MIIKLWGLKPDEQFKQECQPFERLEVLEGDARFSTFAGNMSDLKRVKRAYEGLKERQA